MANLLSTTFKSLIKQKGTASISDYVQLEDASNIVLLEDASGNIITEGSGTNITIDMATGNYFEVDLESASGDISTINITNPPPHARVGTFKLKVTQGSTARNIKWGFLSNTPEDVVPEWPGGESPTITATNNAVDIFSFNTYDAGASWYGKVVGQNF